LGNIQFITIPEALLSCPAREFWAVVEVCPPAAAVVVM
jgi:hypothetical protein